MGDADEVGVALLKVGREEGFTHKLPALFSASSLERWTQKLDSQLALF